MSTETEVTPVPVEKLPAHVIMAQLGYIRPTIVPKRKDRRVERKVTAATAQITDTKNFTAINRFDTFWSSVRSITGLKRVRQGRKVRTHTAPINGRTAPIGAIHRGAKSSDALHLLTTLGKEQK